MEIIHTPVLLQECLYFLNPEEENFTANPFMIDSTLGEGGHSSAFLKKYLNLNILGLDADANIQKRARERLSVYGNRIHFFNGWFNEFYANYPEDISHPDLILFDLGISVYHYEKSGRGFSFRYDEPLDMRLDKNSGKNAADFVNEFSEQDLADLIYRFGEERYSRRIASAIVNERNLHPIETSKHLADIIYSAVPSKYRYGRIHPATRTFQALRIAVNNELGHLPDTLINSFNILNIGGKMGVITFHSLEDRIVKNIFRDFSKKCICPPECPQCCCGGKSCAEILTRKPIIPTAEEIKINSPSRSAKLRVIKKISDSEIRCAAIVGAEKKNEK